MTDVSPSPEDDLEIIESTNVPTDGNTNMGPQDDPSSTPIDPNLLATLGPDPPMQDISAMQEADQMEINEDMNNIEEQVEETNEFNVVNDPNNILQPTDTSIHNKTMSEATGLTNMFDFFKVDDDEPVGDEEYENNENQNEIEPTSKRAESMTGLNKLDYDELNIENLRQFNANISRDTDDENVENDHINEEEKEAQPNNANNIQTDDVQSLASQHGSDGDKQDINVEQHRMSLVNQPDEKPVPPIENNDNTMKLPSFEPHHSMDNIDDLGDLELDDMDTPNAPYSHEQQQPEHIVDKPPMHTKRRSISEMVEQQLKSEMNLNLGDDIDHDFVEEEYNISDDDDFKTAMGDEQNWMETAKKWMAKEKQLKEQIFDLEEDLDALDASNRELQINHEKQIGRYEEEKSNLIQEYEEQISAMQSEHATSIEKINNDNFTLAQDVKLLRHELNEQKRQIDDYEIEIKECLKNLEDKELEWKAHSENCPLLNDEIAKQYEQKKNDEIKKWKLGSQQMDASLGKMLTENKQMDDEIQSLKERINTKDGQIEQRNVEIDKLRKELDTIKESDNKNKGALEELRLREEDERIKRQEVEKEYAQLTNEFDMLLAYSNEQAEVIDAADFSQSGVDRERFQAVKRQKTLFPNGRSGSLSISKFKEHVKNLSNMSDALRQAAFQNKEEIDSMSESSFYSTDVGSIASNFTRFSFQRYHTHDASREFFFLLSLCVKLSLANKYGVSPDICPNNDALWKQALANDIRFHEYYDFLYNELTNLYEYKYKTQQGTIKNVVITDVLKIRNKQEQQSKIKQLENVYNNQSYLYNQYEAYTQGSQSTQSKLNTIKDRTYFNPNDDFFGGNIKITTRANRQMKMERRRSSSSTSSKKSARRERRSSHRHRGSKHNKMKRKSSDRHQKHRQGHSPKIYEKEEKEPGNDHDDHPLNDLQKKRDSEKLSDPPKDELNGKKRSFMHLTKKSLEALDPSRNSSL